MFKWQSPYQNYNFKKVKSIYMLEELDRSQLADIFIDKRLKKFPPDSNFS